MVLLPMMKIDSHSVSSSLKMGVTQDLSLPELVLELDLLHLVQHLDLLVKQVSLLYQFTLVKDLPDLVVLQPQELEQSTMVLVHSPSLVDLQNLQVLQKEELFSSILKVMHMQLFVSYILVLVHYSQLSASPSLQQL